MADVPEHTVHETWSELDQRISGLFGMHSEMMEEYYE